MTGRAFSTVSTIAILQWISLLAAISIYAIYVNSASARALLDTRQWKFDAALRNSIGPKDYLDLASEDDVYVLDTRSRSDFARAHVAGSHNIPIVELPMRGKYEIPRSARVVIYCGSTKDCEQEAIEAGSSTLCTLAIRHLEESHPGIDYKVLNGLLPTFAEDGLMITSTYRDLRLASLNEGI